MSVQSTGFPLYSVGNDPFLLLFLSLIRSDTAGIPFKLTSMFCWDALIILGALPHFLVSQGVPASSSVFPTLKSAISPKGISSYQWRMGFRNQDLACRYSPCYWIASVPRPLPMGPFRGDLSLSQTLIPFHSNPVQGSFTFSSFAYLQPPFWQQGCLVLVTLTLFRSNPTLLFCNHSPVFPTKLELQSLTPTLSLPFLGPSAQCWVTAVPCPICSGSSILHWTTVVPPTSTTGSILFSPASCFLEWIVQEQRERGEKEENRDFLDRISTSSGQPWASWVLMAKITFRGVFVHTWQ